MMIDIYLYHLSYLEKNSMRGVTRCESKSFNIFRFKLHREYKLDKKII